MTSTRSVFITGHRGYIGSIMAPYLMKQGYRVTGLDTGYYRDCTLVPDELYIPELRIDIRDVNPLMFEGYEAVIHLAALSNDPVGRLDPNWTDEINHQATARIAEMAREAGVRRFLLASSCIMYGMSRAALVNEDSPPAPGTDYARSKVRAEEALRALADDDFSPTFLRNGTVYGLSPRMRFDTVLNDLVGSAVTAGEIVVFSDGTPWRPVVHVEDIARSFQCVLEAPRADVHNQAFNNGADSLNSQIITLAEIVAGVVAGCRLEVRGQSGADQRTYKTDFGKFARTFPEFEFKWRPEAGAYQLARALEAIGLTRTDFTSPKFTRLRWLTQLRDTHELDTTLHWTPPVCEAAG